MAKVQMDLQSALDMALEALDEYSESHPDQAKEAVEQFMAKEAITTNKSSGCGSSNATTS